MNELKHIETMVKMPVMSLPVRTTYLRLDNNCILISPGTRLDENIYRTLPQVTDIVAPNLFHLDGVPKAKAYFPDATVWGPSTCHEKRPDIHWDKILHKETWPYQTELEILAIKGTKKIHETVFFHKNTRSLIVADLAFNMLNVRGFGAFIIMNLFGTYKKLGVSRFYLNNIVDRHQFQNSIQELFRFDFQQLIVGHGDIITANAKEMLRQCFLDRGFKI